jgi:hypothetical protein
VTPFRLAPDSLRFHTPPSPPACSRTASPLTNPLLPSFAWAASQVVHKNGGYKFVVELEGSGARTDGRFHPIRTEVEGAECLGRVPAPSGYPCPEGRGTGIHWTSGGLFRGQAVSPQFLPAPRRWF